MKVYLKAELEAEKLKASQAAVDGNRKVGESVTGISRLMMMLAVLDWVTGDASDVAVA